MKTTFCTLLLLLFALPLVAAPTGTIQGRLIDAETGEAVIGAVVGYAPAANPDDMKYLSSAYGGRFEIKGLPYGSYRLTITYIGYEELNRDVEVRGSKVDVGEIAYRQAAQQIETVVKAVQAIRTSVKGDTVSYNAGAFKVAADADVEGLLQKMPGIKVTDGEVEAQGETVKKVFVDGKEFFNEDVTTAIKSLPAEAVDRVEVFDKKSDEAEFTGVDDGEGYKAINIVTHTTMRRGQFGKMYAGYGYDDRYFAGGNVNLFNGSSRTSIIGLLNNINQQNFSFEDILGVSGSSGGGGGFNHSVGQYMVRPQSGIARVASIGLNYSNTLGENDKLKLSGSYFFNNTRTENDKNVDRTYSTGDDYLTDGSSTARNYNHRFNGRLDWKISPNQQLMLRPSFSFQGYRNLSQTLGYYGDNAIDDYSRSHRQGYRAGLSAIYRVKLAENGRSLVFNASGTYSSNDNDALTHSMYTPSDADPYKRFLHALTDSPGYNLRGNVSYNEPLSKSSQLVVQYRASYRYSDSDRRTFVTGPDWSIDGLEPDDALSNVYNSGYLTHQIGPGYRFNRNRSMFVANVSYQYATLAGKQSFPTIADPKLSASFDNVTYFLMGNIYFNASNTLRIMLSSYTSNPSVTQLQEVVDPSTQFITTGNRALHPSYAQSLRMHYTFSSPTKGRTFMVMASGTVQSRYIANSVQQFSKPTPIVVAGQEYQALSFTRPINMNGYWNTQGRVSFGTPVGFLRSNLNLDFGVSYSETPSIINEQKNLARNLGYKAGVVMGSNISDKVDFTLSWRGTYNNLRYSYQPDRNNRYYQQAATGQIKLVLWAGFTFTASAAFTQYKGITDNYNETYTLVNAFIGKKLFRNQRGELIVGVNDLLDQNKSFVRNVTSTYVENVTNSSLGRYFSVQFVFNLRRFGKNASTDTRDYEGVGGGTGSSSRRMSGPGGPPPGGMHP